MSDPMRNPRHDPSEQPGQRPFTKGLLLWLIIIAAIAGFYYATSGSFDDFEKVDNGEFLAAIRAGHVKTVTIKAEHWEGERRDPGDGEDYWPYGSKVKVIRCEEPFSPDSIAVRELYAAIKGYNDEADKYNASDEVKYNKKPAREHIKRYNKTSMGKVWQVFLTILPWVLILGVMYFFLFRHMRAPGGQSILSFGKSRARLTHKEHIQVTFDDVAGIKEAKEEVQEIVEFLKNPDKSRRLGGRLPRGVLLVGAPGTGKTLLAKAIAGEADTPFFSISGSDFVEMFVGVGASRVRDLFQQAKANSPCIIFLDEVDAVGRHRGSGLGGGHDEREQTLNAILVEMDGFDSDDAVIVIAATNRPDVLDPALMRPGRFDRQVVLDLPDITGREAILRVHAKKIKLKSEDDLKTVARATPMFSGADLENLINEAAILATLRETDAVELADFEEARDRVMFGRQKRSRVIDKEDLEKTAYHEAGHAIVAHLDPDHEPLHKVGIIPRGMTLGTTMFLPEKDQYGMGKRKALAEIATLMAGRVAEELFCSDISAGCASDLERASDLARLMVCRWGMSDAVGPVVYHRSQEQLFIGREITRSTGEQVSRKTGELIDSEVRRIIDEGMTRAREILSSHTERVKAVVAALLKHEVLSAEEVDLIIRGEELPDLPNGLRAASSAAAENTGASPAAVDAAVEPQDGAAAGGQAQHNPT
ncbi:MAG: ATP-dependent zinc metalloprotease FtsH [Planctomycetota bacterium]